MNDAEFKGYVTRALEENDRSHKALFDKLGRVEKAVTDLKVSSAKGGAIGGAITAGIAFLIMWAKNHFK